MDNKQYLIIGFIGFIIGASLVPIHAAIPPTIAFSNINSQTDNKTTTATSYSDTLFLRGVGLEINQYIPELAGWCDPNYNYRKTITIDSSLVLNANQTNFPFMYNVTDTDIESRALASGNDIIFCDEDHNQIPHDLDEWQDGGGYLLAWVNVPNVYENIDTDLYVYYDYAGAAVTEDEDATWPSEYWGVWHYNNDLLDASGYDNHGLYNYGGHDPSNYIDINPNYYGTGGIGTGFCGDNICGANGDSRVYTTNSMGVLNYTDGLVHVSLQGRVVNSGAGYAIFDGGAGSGNWASATASNNQFHMNEDANGNQIRRGHNDNMHTSNPSMMISTYSGATGAETDIETWYNAEIESGSWNVEIVGQLNSTYTKVENHYLDGLDYRTDRGQWGVVSEEHVIFDTWSIDKTETVFENYYNPDGFYSTGAEENNIAPIPDRAVEFSLSVPTSTVLGGVLQSECAGGDFVTGINSTDGGLLCDTP